MSDDVKAPGKETVCQEADRLVTDDRQSVYGSPWNNFSLASDIITPMLRTKLKDGVKLEPEDIAFFMIGLKLARELNKHKRDSIVDAIGYLKCLDLVVEERSKIEEKKK